ncbi:MAG: hypothetical protein R3E50_03710 [Halioglobus sp.]
MGPGNFSVSVRVSAALKVDESLQLFMDGQPWGDPQRGTIWDLTNVFRGQHDLTVGVIDASGETLAMSPPVRVFVHRPSINFQQTQANAPAARQVIGLDTATALLAYWCITDGACCPGASRLRPGAPCQPPEGTRRRPLHKIRRLK